MPPCDCDSSPFRSASSSCLGDSLIRLQQSLALTRESKQAVERRFSVWQERWALRCEEMMRHIESIDARLESLAGARGERPRLGIVGGTLRLAGPGEE